MREGGYLKKWNGLLAFFLKFRVGFLGVGSLGKIKNYGLT